MADLFIRVFKVDRVTAGTSWRYDGIRDPYWRMYRNEQDGASIVSAGQRTRLRAGRVYLVPRDVTIDCLNTRDVRHFFVHFDVHGLPRRVHEEFFRAPIGIPGEAPATSRVAELAASVPWTGAASEIARDARVQACVLDVLAAYLESLPDERLAMAWQTGDTATSIQPALDFIAHRLGAHLSNAELAGRCHMSEDHFIRTFRECMGSTPNRYITDQRLAVAAQLLRFTDTPIDEIAVQTGFGNRAYMTRLFTRAMGVPPAQYRRSSRA